MIFYLHISGTFHWDCKWLFTLESDLKSFIQTLPLDKIFVENFKRAEDGTLLKKGSETLTGEDALEYWEDHISITVVDENKLTNFRKFFKAPYWEGSQDGQAKRSL